MMTSNRYRVGVLRDHRQVEAVQQERAALHNLVRPGTPFEHPGWLLPWARRFVPEGDLFVVECATGRIVWRRSLPMYRRQWTAGGRRAVWSVRPLATGQALALTELVQVLVTQWESRDVLRAVARQIEEHAAEWDWFQLSIGPMQGWFVPQWLDRHDELSLLHRATRASVVLNYEDRTAEEMRAGLKPNIRDSLRQTRNRLKRSGGQFEDLVVEDPGQLGAAFDRVWHLHRRRAQHEGRVRHVEAIRSLVEADFAREAVRTFGRYGLARVFLLVRDGQDIAGAALLTDGSTDYVSLMGLAPEHWERGAMTHIIGEVVRDGISRGRRALNLSAGPDQAKVRWSERLVFNHDFVVVAPGRRSQLVSRTFSQGEALHRLRDARRRFRVHRPVPGQG